MSDIAMIIIIFALLVFVPLISVFIVLGIVKKRRKNKHKKYTGITEGIILKIVDKGAGGVDPTDNPFVIHVSYSVDGENYTIKETAKQKSEPIKIGGIPVGQKKVFVLGPVAVGDKVTIKYDCSNPAKAIIAENEGLITS